MHNLKRNINKKITYNQPVYILYAQRVATQLQNGTLKPICNIESLEISNLIISYILDLEEVLNI